MDAKLFATSCLVCTGLLIVLVSTYYPLLVSLILVFCVSMWSYWHNFFSYRLPNKDKYVILTGCDSGLGHGMAKLLDTKGCCVIAGCFLPDEEGAEKLKNSCSNRLHVVHLDVSSDDSVQLFLEKTQQILGANELWGLVNNAGIQFNGEIEFTPMDYYKSNMEVNYFGIVRMCKTFIYLLRQSKGRIINVTSVLGKYSLDNTCTYSPTKFAAEAFSDILRREMKKFGVCVSIVEPGNFSDVTSILQVERSRRQNEYMWNQCPSHIRDTYSEDYIKNIGLNFVNTVTKGATSNINSVLKAVDDGLFSSRPKTRYIADAKRYVLDPYAWAARFSPLLPDRVMDIIVHKFL